MVKHAYSDEELRRIPPVVVNPGVTGPDGITRGHEERNPFWLPALAREPGAEDCLRRWSDLHENRDMAPAADPLGAFLSDLGMADSGFYRHENAENGNTVFFPNVPNLKGPAQRAAEDAWEASCKAMHDAQRPVELERKPQPNVLEKIGIKRGD